MISHKNIITLITTVTTAGLITIGLGEIRIHAEDISVDSNSTVRAVSHVASGGLYALSDANTPNTSLLAPLKLKTITQAPPFGQQIPNGEPKAAGQFNVIQPAAHNLGAKVMVRLPDYYDKFAYNFDSLDKWKSHVTQMVNEAKKNSGDIYAYELWNEPNGYWKTPTDFGDGKSVDAGNYKSVTYMQLWDETYKLVKQLDSSAKIVGPSLDGLGSSQMKWMQEFLLEAKKDGTLPDYISWHQWSASAYPGQAQTLEKFELAKGITKPGSMEPLPISINEYGDRQELGVPGQMVHYIQSFENDNYTDSADLAFWYNYGRMDNLLTDQQKPNGGYWLYKWYGDMSGNIDTTSTSSENNSLATLASTNADKSQISVIFGGANGDNSVTVNHLDASKFANGAKIQVNESPWYGVDTAVTPKTIETGTVQVKNGMVTVPVKGMKASSGYQLIVTPANATAIKGDIQYTPQQASDPIRVEAENGSLTGGAKKTLGSYASGNYYVGGIDKNDSSITMNVNALQDGDYKLDIGYANGNTTTATEKLTLNGTALSDASFKPTTGWTNADPNVDGTRKVLQYGSVHLNKGTNTFKIAKGDNNAEIDYAQFTLISNNNGGGSDSSSTVPSSSSNTSSSSTSSSSSTTTPSTSIIVPKSAAKKDSIVYALKKVNLYKNANFKTAKKVATYTKRTRVNRPRFVVTGYARSSNGALRYQVRDANRGRKTYGKKGYITAKISYVRSAYYQSIPKSKTITVIANRGGNAYKTSKLTSKVKHYKKGTQLKVKKLVNYHSTTRYELFNGHFVSGSKVLVIQGHY